MEDEALSRAVVGVPASSRVHASPSKACLLVSSPFVLTLACFNAGGYKCKACEAPPWRPVP
eukprot:8372776-Lingulodinium_polyedra.AAC.1